MKNYLSVMMIVKNEEQTIEKSLKSVYGWVKEIIVVDDFSTDKTCEIAKKHSARIFQKKYLGEGSQRQFGLRKIKTKWVLILDADEVVSSELKKEILAVIQYLKYSGFQIPIQSYYLGKKIYHGGENYSKMILFQTDKGCASKDQIHSVCVVKDGKTNRLKSKLDHYSYRSLTQIFKKFTDYAIRQARRKKLAGEKTSLKKIFLYPPHMFWARFIKDRGYKDGLFRLPLDLAFVYMEFLIYTIMLFNFEHQNNKRR